MSIMRLFSVFVVVGSITAQASALHQQTPRTLQSFGVTVQRGFPVHPLPANVALGLFDPDRLLDIAVCDEGRVKVFQNMGNGSFSDDPVWERPVEEEVLKMEWHKSRMFSDSIEDIDSWGDLIINYANGRSERISHEQMVTRSGALTGVFSAPPPLSPPLAFNRVWRSERNYAPNQQLALGDIDNDGKAEIMYWFIPASGSGDSAYRLVVYENIGNDTYAVDWDTIAYTMRGGPFAITDIDNNGFKEIVTANIPKGVGTVPTIALLECSGPGQYRFYETNIGLSRSPFTVREADIDHNGIKDLIVLTSTSWHPIDPTLIIVAHYSGKSIIGTNRWLMSFNGTLARYQGYVFDMAVGQVDGQGWDEIIPAGGSFGYYEPAPIDYLWYSGLPNPNTWLVRQIHTGLESGTAAVMFVNLDADTTKEFVSGAPGPIGRGSMFALKYLSDTTWSVLWADSSLRSSPLHVNAGIVNGEFVVAGASIWAEIAQNTRISTLHVYRPSGHKLGAMEFDSLGMQEFHFLDIDGDGRTNLIFAHTGNLNNRLADYESDTVVVSVDPPQGVPERFALFQNYPNPFNPTTAIRFHLPVESAVEIRIYDLLGREVRTLAHMNMEAGTQTIVWNGTSNEGGDAASGVYFYRLVARKGVEVLHRETKKMVLLR